MKLKFIPLAITFFFILSACTQKEIPYFSHVYGRLQYNDQDSTGFNNVILQIRDLNPDNPGVFRFRDVTTTNHDSQDGFFEMDSVCYGTSGYMTSEIVRILCDSLKNPGYKTKWWFPNIMHAVDTIIIYLNM